MAIATPDRMQGQFFIDEHRRIHLGLAALEETLLELHHMNRIETLERMTRILGWLRRDLLPHVAWEEASLFARLDAVAGSPWPGRLLRWEHQELRDLAVLLERQFVEVNERWSLRVAFELAAALARMDAILAAHLWQEEDVVQPLLEGSLQPSMLASR
jgi:hemerythrin-like domain-containing protein